MGSSGAGKTTLMDVRPESSRHASHHICTLSSCLTWELAVQSAETAKDVASICLEPYMHAVCPSGQLGLAPKYLLAAQVLAGRKTTGTIRGDIWVNGHPKVQDTFKRVCGYVEQFGAHLLTWCSYMQSVLHLYCHAACSLWSSLCRGPAL